MTRLLISALALSAALSFSGGAMAQTMVGGQTVSADDLPKVQAACEALAADAKLPSATATDNDSSNDAQDDSGTDNGGDDTSDTDDGDDPGAGVAATSVDLALLTYETCKEAGLVE